jgi:hypothetical protein
VTPLAWLGVVLVLGAVSLVVAAGWMFLGEAPSRPLERLDEAPPPPTPPDARTSRTTGPVRAARPPERTAGTPADALVRADRADRWALARVAGLEDAVAWREIAPSLSAGDLDGADTEPLRVSALESLEDALPGQVARRVGWIVASGMLTIAIVHLLPVLTRLGPP